MWIIPTREYNEDPVFASMSPAHLLRVAAPHHPRVLQPGRRQARGALLHRPLRLRPLYTPVPTSNDGQYEGLRKLVEEKQPKVIGINESDAWNHADGITANEKRRLLEALGPTYASRVKSAEMLAVGWLEVKLPEELEAYRHAMKVAHLVIREAFSNKVITPGHDDFNRTWCGGCASGWPSSASARGSSPRSRSRKGGEKAPPQGVIQPGDMLHTDFGIVYMGLSTDTQHNAYVLRPGETDAPQGLKEGLKAANRLQDLTMQYARLERTGNQALADARAHAKREGLVPSIYCHAIGYHGHGAGPPIGMTDYQEGVPVRGDYVFRPNTWHSIELNVDPPGPGVGRPAGALRARGGRGDACPAAGGTGSTGGRRSSI